MQLQANVHIYYIPFIQTVGQTIDLLISSNGLEMSDYSNFGGRSSGSRTASFARLRPAVAAESDAGYAPKLASVIWREKSGSTFNTFDLRP